VRGACVESRQGGGARGLSIVDQIWLLECDFGKIVRMAS
jgi:hypothetical protein